MSFGTASCFFAATASWRAFTGIAFQSRIWPLGTWCMGSLRVCREPQITTARAVFAHRVAYMPGQRLGAHHDTRHPPPAKPGTPLHAGKAMTQLPGMPFVSVNLGAPMVMNFYR